jgi:hypothetical protein
MSTLGRREYIRKTKKELDVYFNKRFGKGKAIDVAAAALAFNEFFKGRTQHPRAAFRLINHEEGGQTKLTISIYDPLQEKEKA